MSEGVLIALDWGTTNVRATLLAADGSPLDERRGESGVGTFTPQQFGARFDALSKDWPEVPVIAAGMIGSKQGWHEAGYIPCPCSPDDLSQSLAGFEHNSQNITIVPGIKLSDGNRHDVMRGEETQIAGLIAMQPSYDGTVIMPGTHSKWVSISNGTIDDFRTYMTGELFEVIGNNTILSHSLTANEMNHDAFSKKVCELAASSHSLEGQLFALRAKHLLADAKTEDLYQELSALLIIAELKAGIADGFDMARGVTLVGAEKLTSLYQIAAKALGVDTFPKKGTSLIWPALFDLAKRAQLMKV